MMTSFQLAFLGMKILLITLTLLTSAQASAPDWFSDYVKANSGCDHQYLCAVGDGETLADALSEARSEVAKFFQTKVKAKTQIANSTEQKSDNPSLGSFDEWTNKTVSEETSELISGLEIKKQESIDGHSYVLMTLDRSKTAKMLKEKIDELDLEDSKLMELNSRFTYPKMMNNLMVIEAFSDRYNLLTNAPLKLLVKKETLLSKLNKLSPLKMSLTTVGKKLPTKLSHTLIDLLSPLKVVIVSQKQSPKYTVRSEVITEEQYFKVDGFKKLNVVLRLELISNKGQTMGKMSALSEQVARTDEQAIENAIPDIKLYLQDNLDQLSTNKMED